MEKFQIFSNRKQKTTELARWNDNCISSKNPYRCSVLAIRTWFTRLALLRRVKFDFNSSHCWWIRPHANKNSVLHVQTLAPSLPGSPGSPVGPWVPWKGDKQNDAVIHVTHYDMQAKGLRRTLIMVLTCRPRSPLGPGLPLSPDGPWFTRLERLFKRLWVKSVGRV